MKATWFSALMTSNGKKVRVHENQPIIVEGIHALNPRMLGEKGISLDYFKNNALLTRLLTDAQKRFIQEQED